MKTRRFFLPAMWGIIGLAFAAAMALVFGLIVMALWNWLMPEIFGLPTIAYWQAWGLVLLAHILFKSGHGNHQGRSRRWSKRDTEEFKERVKGRFSDHGYGPDYRPHHRPRRESDDAQAEDEGDPEESPEDPA